MVRNCSSISPVLALKYCLRRLTKAFIKWKAQPSASSKAKPSQSLDENQLPESLDLLLDQPFDAEASRRLDRWLWYCEAESLSSKRSGVER